MKVMELVALPKSELGLLTVALASNPPKFLDLDCWESLAVWEKAKDIKPTTQVRRDALEMIRRFHAEGVDTREEVQQIKQRLYRPGRQFGSPSACEMAAGVLVNCFDIAVDSMDTQDAFNHARVAAVYHSQAGYGSMKPDDEKAWEEYRRSDGSYPITLPERWEYMTKDEIASYMAEEKLKRWRKFLR